MFSLKNLSPQGSCRPPSNSPDGGARSADAQPVRVVALANGLNLQFFDESRRYFGDYFRVRILATVDISLDHACFPDDAELRTARQFLPAGVCFRKVTEKMGVPSAEVEAVISALITDFLRHAGSYLGSAAFPSQYIRAELARIRTSKRTMPFVPPSAGA